MTMYARKHHTCSTCTCSDPVKAPVPNCRDRVIVLERQLVKAASYIKNDVPWVECNDEMVHEIMDVVSNFE